MKTVVVFVLLLLIPSGAIALKKVNEIQVVDSTGKSLGIIQSSTIPAVVALEHDGTTFYVSVARDFISGGFGQIGFESSDCTGRRLFLDPFLTFIGPAEGLEVAAVAPPGFTVYLRIPETEAPVTIRSIFSPFSGVPDDCVPTEFETTAPLAGAFVELPFTAPFAVKVKTGQPIK